MSVSLSTRRTTVCVPRNKLTLALEPVAGQVEVAGRVKESMTT